MSETRQVATMASGCFWCTEAVFNELKGVEKVESGYSGGTIANPSYEQVCTGDTGHAEAVQVTFDPKQISYKDVLTIFFTTHDPTTKDRQEPTSEHNTDPRYSTTMQTSDRPPSKSLRNSTHRIYGSIR